MSGGACLAAGSGIGGEFGDRLQIPIFPSVLGLASTLLGPPGARQQPFEHPQTRLPSAGAAGVRLLAQVSALGFLFLLQPLGPVLAREEHLGPAVAALGEVMRQPRDYDPRASYTVYDTEERAFERVPVTIGYRTDGGIKNRTFTVFRSHHGPIVRSSGGKWIAVKLMQDPIRALTELVGSPLEGALIGGAVGAGTGALTNKSQVNLGRPIWR